MTRDSRSYADGAGQGGRPALGDALRALRLAGGISQEGWAARLGVGRRTVVRWEQGDTVPDAVMAEVLLAACEEKGLFRRASVTPEQVRDLLATARLGRPESSGRGSGAADDAGGTVTYGNLPAPLTSFIGRDAEMEEVARQLETARLLTLTGAGGCGKTRLAIETARRFESRYADGAWLAELAGLTDADAVVAAVAAALSVKEEPGRAAADTLTGWLRSRRPLLVLDNAEHLREACATLTERLLRACPGLTVLVTSRVALGVLGETVWRVPSLAAPNPAQAPGLEALGHFPSVQLFIARARAARTGFSLTDANAAAVAQICHRLDGIPLAIELAAARTSVLTAEQIATHLDDRFALLKEGNRTALPRQRTLRALIDWSYDLLTAAEQRLFCRVSVFAGGFTLDAVESICADQDQHVPAVLDLLGSLVAHSLVVAEEAGGAMRYRLLETLREYASARLTERGDRPPLCARHRDYCLALAEEAEAPLMGREQVRWLRRLTEEHDNLRVALGSCVEGPDGAEAGQRLAGALWRFWELRGHLAEGREWLERVLALSRSTPPGVRARALGGAGNLARGQGDYAAAGQLYDESLALARAGTDQAFVATALTRLGLVRMNDGDYPAARALLEEGLALRTALADQWGIGNTLHNLAYLAYCEGDAARAEALYEECLRVRRDTGDADSIAVTLNNLGTLARLHGEYARARSLFEESLALQRGLQDDRGVVFALRGLGETSLGQKDYGAARAMFGEGLRIAARLGMQKNIADCLEGMAAVAASQMQHGRAARLLGAVETLRVATGVALVPDEHAEHERLLVVVRAAMDAETFASARAAGRAMAVQDAIARALGDAPCAPPE